MAQHTPAPDRRRLVETWQRSTTSKTAFARAHGVKPATFATWVRREERPAWTAPPQVGAIAVPAFLPVQRAPLMPSPERAATAVTVAVGDHVLRFADAPPAAWFAAVVRELVSC
jgi:hypothetical protein